MTTPRTLTEAVEVAYALMQGDPATLQAGYTLENAALAVADVFGFDRTQVEARLREYLR